MKHPKKCTDNRPHFIGGYAHVNIGMLGATHKSPRMVYVYAVTIATNDNRMGTREPAKAKKLTISISYLCYRAAGQKAIIVANSLAMYC